MVDVVQSHGASSLAAAVAALGVAFFGAAVTTFEPVALVAAIVVAVPFFLPISTELSCELWFFCAQQQWGVGAK
jgi:hypothetical protein